MNKKRWTLSCTAVLCTALLAGCSTSCPSGGSTAEPSSSNDSQPLSVEAQLQLILEQKNVWGQLDEDYSDDLSYMVSDLDQDGLLEIVSASISGTGLYTTGHFYEVNSTGDGLELCTYSIPEGDSEADLSISDSVPCYYDAGSDMYYYIFNDTIHAGAAEYYLSSIAISLKDCTVTPQTLGTQLTIYTDPEKDPTVTYLRNDGTEISKDEFDALADAAFPNAEKKQADLVWFSPYNIDENAKDAAALSDDDLLEQLNTSWKGFSVQ